MITKDPRRQERGKKITRDVHENVTRKILEDNQLFIPSPMDRPIPSTSSLTDRPTTSALSPTGNSTGNS